jgi:arginine deiminase
VLVAPDFMNQTRTYSYRPSNHPSGVELHPENKPFVDVVAPFFPTKAPPRR